MRSLDIGALGMQAQSTNVDVTSHNIANTHTTATICTPRASTPPGQGSCISNAMESVHSATKASPKNDPEAAAQHTTAPPSKLPRVNALGTHFQAFMWQI